MPKKMNTGDAGDAGENTGLSGDHTGDRTGQVCNTCPSPRCVVCHPLENQSKKNLSGVPDGTSQPTCPQCNHDQFTTISPSLSRCGKCRWLVRIGESGRVSTAFDPWRKPKRKRTNRNTCFNRRSHGGWKDCVRYANAGGATPFGAITKKDP